MLPLANNVLVDKKRWLSFCSFSGCNWQNSLVVHLSVRFRKNRVGTSQTHVDLLMLLLCVAVVKADQT